MQSNIPSKEGYISVTGGKVWYKQHGTSSVNKNPLLILHGGPGVPHNYLNSISKLADKRAVIFYDQLGCGNSDAPSDTNLWKLSRFVEELQLIIKALDLDKIHLLGHSWGEP